MQEIYVSDVLLFPCRYPQKHRPSSDRLSPPAVQGRDPAFKRGAMEQEVLAKCGGTANKSFLDLI